MDIVDANQYRVRGNRLHFHARKFSSVEIPFGMGLRMGKHRPRLRVQATDGCVDALEFESRTSWRPLLPIFTRIIRGKGRRPTLLLETAVTQLQRREANELIRDAHYLTPRRGGLLLLAYKPGGKLLGVVQIERFAHGHPHGRASVYRHDGRRPRPAPRIGERPGFRRRVLHELGLYWISRVAVAARWRRIGVGSILCDAAREVVASRMLETGRYIELMRQVSLDQLRELQAGEADFLTGYSETFRRQLPFYFHGATRSRGRDRYRQDPGSGEYLAYYFAKAGPMVLDHVSTRSRRGRKK